MIILPSTPRTSFPLTQPSVTFEQTLQEHGLPPLLRNVVETLQINVGKRCNMACHHCHVEAGPLRSEEMSGRVAERALELVKKSKRLRTVDLTGGAPELNPHFRSLVQELRKAGKEVIDRTNLTIFLAPGNEELPEFLADQQVHLVASLPCYGEENVDQQRGKGAFGKSIEALQRLNQLGYGQTGSSLKLDLVYNPGGAFLPPDQKELEVTYRKELSDHFDISFHHLLTITNMPIKRFADFLEQTAQREAYMSLLVNHFNSTTVSKVMCKSLLSVGWNGDLFDCDFNQMLDLPLRGLSENRALTLWHVDHFDELGELPITTDDHCFGCTAGSGSSCSGAFI